MIPFDEHSKRRYLHTFDRDLSKAFPSLHWSVYGTPSAYSDASSHAADILAHAIAAYIIVRFSAKFSSVAAMSDTVFVPA